MRVINDIKSLDTLTNKEVAVFLGGYAETRKWASEVIEALESFKGCRNLVVLDFENNDPIDYLRIIKNYKLDIVSIYITKERDFDMGIVHESQLVIDELGRSEYPKRIITSIEPGVAHSEALAIYCELALGVPFVNENATPANHALLIHDSYLKIKNRECPYVNAVPKGTKLDQMLSRFRYIIFGENSKSEMCKLARKVCNYNCSSCNWN